MKNFSFFLFVLYAVFYVSCVNRIDIPKEEDSKLYISLEMLAGDSVIIADLKTSNNLNGIYPIIIPKDAEITVTEVNSAEKDTKNERILEYDSDLGKYVANNATDFLSRNKEFELIARIGGAEFEEITATTIVPDKIQIKNTELLSEDEFIDNEGNKYWEGVVGLTFTASAGNKGKFGHLLIKGYETEINITSEGDTLYAVGLDSRLFNLVGVEVGTGAITDMVHRDGFLIDFSNLEDDYIEIILRSPFPITKENHITAFLFTDIFSLTQAHHDYHVSLHNIKKNQGNIFDEHALYNSNIKNGLGLFSSCAIMKDVLELR